MRHQYEKNKEHELLKKVTVRMENFRGNIIIDEEDPYEEDRYRVFEIRPRVGPSTTTAMGGSDHASDREEDTKSQGNTDIEI